MTSCRTAALPRLVIDVEKIRHLNTGLGRFCLHLAEEIIRQADGRFRPVLFLPSGTGGLFPAGTFDTLPAQAWRKEGCVRWLRPVARPFLRADQPRLWHMTHQAAKYFPLDRRTAVMLTIHDLNFLQEEGGSPRRHARKLAAVQRRIDRAAVLTAVSQFTADEVRRQLDVKGKPVHVVPNGLPAPPAAAAVRPAFLAAGPFLLTVGNVLPHKNFQALVGLMEKLPGRRLVIAGKKATPTGAALEAAIDRGGLRERVILPGEVTDADRQWLYEHCEAFLFPSLAEGFGFPVLEAMQCGKPVFAARRTSLPEVGGLLVNYFDSFDPDAMATVFHDGMARIARMPDYAAEARARAAAYSWSRAAAAYLELSMPFLERCA